MNIVLGPIKMTNGHCSNYLFLRAFPVPDFLRLAIASLRFSGKPRAFPAFFRRSDKDFAQRGCRRENPCFARYSRPVNPCDFRCFGESILNSWPHSMQTILFFWIDFSGEIAGAEALPSKEPPSAFFISSV